MAGRKTRPSTRGEQPHFAVRPGLSSRGPNSKSPVLSLGVILSSASTGGVASDPLARLPCGLHITARMTPCA
jgi:hypothetical protein